MVVEGPKLHGLTTKQLNNRNFNEELRSALENGKLSKEEAKELFLVFNSKSLV